MKGQVFVRKSRLTFYILTMLGAVILAGIIVSIVLLANGSIAVKGMTYKGWNEHGYREYIHEQTGMVFVLIPAGIFKMGSNDGEHDEKPVHEVQLDSFLISKYEVTQEVWQRIMKTNPSCFKGNQNPVECVTWNDCQEFCKKTGLRMPAEAEWEYACRAGSDKNYFWGDKDYVYYMWYGGNSGNSTHPTGYLVPNGFGLYDMSGNVWEWCEDWYGDACYKNSAKNNPRGPDSGQYRVLRGGSWFSNAGSCRSAARYGIIPSYSDGYNGFRAAASMN